MATVTETKTEKSFTLTINEAEAAVLRALVSNVGGPPGEGGKLTHRGHASAIGAALHSAGVEHTVEADRHVTLKTRTDRPRFY